MQILELIQITWVIYHKIGTGLSYAGNSHFLAVFLRTCLLVW